MEKNDDRQVPITFLTVTGSGRNADYFFAFLTCIPNVPLLTIVELIHDSLLLLSFLLRWFTYSVDSGFLSVVSLVSLNAELI